MRRMAEKSSNLPYCISLYKTIIHLSVGGWCILTTNQSSSLSWYLLVRLPTNVVLKRTVVDSD